MEAKCLTYWMEQVEIVNNKHHFHSCLSFVIEIDMAKMHKKLISDKFDI